MPGSTTSNSKKLYWIYVLLSQSDGNRYIGFSRRPLERIKEHSDGLVFSTKHRRPLKLIYIEGCISEEDAKRREKYLKTTGGRRFLAKRLKSFYATEK